MGEQGIAIGGANMWALLLDKDPGHSAAAADLAVDVVDRKLKKAGGIAAVVEVAKTMPAKRGEMVKKEKRGVAGGRKQAPATVVDGGQVNMNGSVDSKQAAAAATVVDRKLKKAGVTAVVEVPKAKPVKRGETVKKEKQGAAGASKQAPATVDGAQVQMTGAGDSKQAAAAACTVPDDVEKPTPASCEEIKRKLAALLGLEEGGEVQMTGAGTSKQAAASGTVPDDVEKPTSPSREEIRRKLYALLGLEEGEAEEEAKEEEVFGVVAARRGRRRTVAAPTSKPAVVAESSTVATGANMWALLSDNDPGHGGATRPAKRGKKSKTKKKKNAAGASNQADTVDGDGEEEAPAGELEEEMSEEEGEEMPGEAPATVSSRCRTVASRVCVCAAVAVGVLGLFCQLVFPVAV